MNIRKKIPLMYGTLKDSYESRSSAERFFSYIPFINPNAKKEREAIQRIEKLMSEECRLHIDKDVLKAQGLKVPHMGWNNLEHVNGECKILKDVPETSDFYFVHSYHVIPDDESIIAGTCDYGGSVVASLSQNNLFSTQFHPEKSGIAGLKILKNFTNLEI